MPCMDEFAEQMLEFYERGVTQAGNLESRAAQPLVYP